MALPEMWKEGSVQSHALPLVRKEDGLGWKPAERGKGVKRPKDEKAVRRWMKNPASDTELYKMWGNGIALPCALYVFEGIALQINLGDSPGSNESLNQEKGERSV